MQNDNAHSRPVKWQRNTVQKLRFAIKTPNLTKCDVEGNNANTVSKIESIWLVLVLENVTQRLNLVKRQQQKQLNRRVAENKKKPRISSLVRE